MFPPLSNRLITMKRPRSDISGIDLSNEENLKGMMAMGAKFAGYAPHLKGAIQPDESVGLMLNLLNKASIEKGDGGSFISHLGNQQWL